LDSSEVSSQSAQEIPTDPLLFSTRKPVLGDRTWGCWGVCIEGWWCLSSGCKREFEKIVVLWTTTPLIYRV